MIYKILNHINAPYLIGRLGIKTGHLNEYKIVLVHKSGAASCDIDKVELVDLNNLANELIDEINWLYRAYPMYRDLWSSESFITSINNKEVQIIESPQELQVPIMDNEFSQNLIKVEELRLNSLIDDYVQESLF